MVAWTLLCGVMTTIAITIIQVGYEFYTGEKEIQHSLERIQDTTSDVLANAIWNLDDASIEAALNGLSNQPNVIFIELWDNLDTSKIPRWSKGTSNPEHHLTKDFLLYQKSNTGPIKIGVARITATTEHLKETIFARTMVILSTQAGKALILSILIYFFLNVEILRPLAQLLEIVQRINPKDGITDFSVERLLPNTNDEISNLTQAVKFMSQNIKEAYCIVEDELQSKERMQSQMLQMAHEAGIAESSTGILHDVANVTSGNMLYIEMAKLAIKSIPDEGIRTKVKECIEKLEQRIELTGKIIRAQQKMAGGATAIDSFPVIDLISDSLMLEDRQMTKDRIHIIKNFTDNAIIRGNRPQLISVLVNIFKNARESIADAKQESGEILVVTRILRDEIAILITDNGLGASSETLVQIFTRGYTTKKAGHGFGLTTCHAIIKNFGGKIGITSAGIGKGATITITLPIVEHATKSTDTAA